MRMRRWIWLGVGVLIAYWVILNVGVWFNHAFLDCAPHPLCSSAAHVPRISLPIRHGVMLCWLLG